MRVACFTKSFQDWPLERACREFAAIGFDGLDLTVRKGGSIEPANVAKELPAAIETAHQYGLTVLQITSDVTDADAKAEQVFSAAAEHDINRIKLGYYPYKPFGTLTQQMDDVRTRLDAVAKLAARYQVLPCVHIHSGNDIPSHGTMLYELIKDMPVDRIGAYVDPLHMTLEGGLSGWLQGLDLLAPWIKLVAIKNFDWHKTKRDSFGQQRWATSMVPLEEGVAPLPDFIATLRKLGYDGTYSLHSEYKGKHSFRDMNTADCLKQTAADYTFFKRLFA